MNYFMIINGQQAGPFPKEELLQHGLTRDTPVWTEGMQDWRPAGQIADLQDLFATNAAGHGPQPNPYRQYAPGEQPVGYRGNGHGNGSTHHPHTNWMPWAIVSCVLNLCSCIGLVFSILGIVNASKADKFYNIGDLYQGDEANRTAKIMTIIALVFGGLGVIGNILYAIFYGAAAMATLAQM